MQENHSLKPIKYPYKGFYYPVFGSNILFENYKSKVVKTKWLFGFPYGLKCRLTDPSEPFKAEVIDTIINHPEMELKKYYFNDSGNEVPYSEHHIYIVYTRKGGYIGDISSANKLLHLTRLKDSRGFNKKTISTGYDSKNNVYIGWSHRAVQAFGIGSKIFEENYGDDTTPFSLHGSKDIKTIKDMKLSAQRFAKYVS